MLARQRAVATHAEAGAPNALDHDAGHVKAKFVPTVTLKVEKPTSADCSWYRGSVKIILKNSIFEPSTSYGALAEVERNYVSELREKPVLVMKSDGGGEHNLSFQSVQTAFVALFKRNSHNLDKIVAMNSAPYHSFVNEVERIMSIINLALYGVAIERPKIDEETYPGEEDRFRRTKTIAELRKTGDRFPSMVKGFNEAVQPLFDVLMQRFVQLSLKGEKFSRGETVSSERVDDFFNSVKPMLSDPTVKRGEVKRKHVTADCEYKRFWDSHVLADRYKCVCCVPPARSLSRI